MGLGEWTPSWLPALELDGHARPRRQLSRVSARNWQFLTGYCPHVLSVSQSLGVVWVFHLCSVLLTFLFVIKYQTEAT